MVNWTFHEVIFDDADNYVNIILYWIFNRNKRSYREEVEMWNDGTNR